MKEVEGKKIRISMDGPYELHGDIHVDLASIGTNAQGDSIAWVHGRSYEKKDEPAEYKNMEPPHEPTYLCRCGHSKTKPFCDGTHDDVGFCGHEHAGRAPYVESAEVQPGEGVNLLDDPSLCVGARFCDVGATVWRYAQRSGDPENKKLAIEEACKCPSGRLTIMEQDGSFVEPRLEPKVSAVQDPINNCRGPLWVQGGIAVEGANGEQYETRNRVTLCRCGESANQPYCDGSHYNCPHMLGQDT